MLMILPFCQKSGEISLMRPHAMLSSLGGSAASSPETCAISSDGQAKSTPTHFAASARGKSTQCVYSGMDKIVNCFTLVCGYTLARYFS